MKSFLTFRNVERKELLFYIVSKDFIGCLFRICISKSQVLSSCSVFLTEIFSTAPKWLLFFFHLILQKSPFHTASLCLPSYSGEQNMPEAI